MIEATTENIVENLYGNDEKYFNFSDDVHYNLSIMCAYPSLVCIIKQMEFILEKDTQQCVFNGKIDFFKEFANRYGKDLFRYIKYKANRLANVRIKYKKDIKFLKEVQDEILVKVFDKEFENVACKEHAKIFIERLSNFEAVRAYIKGDNSFEQYYNEKLSKILNLMHNQGISEEECEEFSKKYAYKGWLSNLMKTEEQIQAIQKYHLKQWLINNIPYINKVKNKNIEETIRQFEIFYLVKNGIVYQLIGNEKRNMLGYSFNMKGEELEFPERLSIKEFKIIKLDEQMVKETASEITEIMEQIQQLEKIALKQRIMQVKIKLGELHKKMMQKEQYTTKEYKDER